MTRHTKDCELRRRSAVPTWPDGESCWCAYRAMLSRNAQMFKSWQERMWERYREDPTGIVRFRPNAYGELVLVSDSA